MAFSVNNEKWQCSVCILERNFQWIGSSSESEKILNFYLLPTCQEKVMGEVSAKSIFLDEN